MPILKLKQITNFKIVNAYRYKIKRLVNIKQNLAVMHNFVPRPKIQIVYYNSTLISVQIFLAFLSS